VAEHKHYDRQPLIEAIFELFAAPEVNTAWAAGSLACVAMALPEYSSHEEHIRDVGIKLDVGPEGTLRPSALQPRERVRRWDAPRQKAVQFGSHMCAHNVLSAAYTHFEDHKETIGRVLRCYLSEARPERLAWIGQRYINLVKLPEAGSAAEYFEIYPKLPDRLAGRHRPLAVQVATVEFKNGSAMVNLSFQAIEAGTANYLLDIYARSTGELPIDADALLRWQVEAHEAIYESFQLSASAKSKLDLFKERS